MTPMNTSALGTQGPGANADIAPRSAGKARWTRWLAMLTIGVSLVVIARVLPVDRMVVALSSRVERMGPWAPVAFGSAYAVAAILFVPGSALTIASGAIFGLGMGTLVVSISSTAAAVVAFLIGRTLARPSIIRAAAASPRFAALDRAIAEGGWRVIALLRLSPAVPFSLGNYLFGLTSIRAVPYTFASWLAMLPGTFLYVYLGHLGRSGVDAATGAVARRSTGEWAALFVGLVATGVVTVYVARLAKSSLRSTGATASTVTPEESASPVPASDTRAGRGVVGVVAAAIVAIAAAILAATQRATIAGWFGPPRVVLAERFAGRRTEVNFDHSELDILLREHVDGQGRVDYARLVNRKSALEHYLADVATARLDRLGRDDRLAFLINAYNAATLLLVLEHYPISSIKQIPAARRWDDVRWRVGGIRLSLNALEHEHIRPDFRDPRVHFALVCAAVGCPPLRSEAYVGARVEQQLESQAVRVHQHDRWCRHDPAGGRLELTAIYDWYGDDFRQVAGSVLAFAARYTPTVRAAIANGRHVAVEFLPYDWSLNAREERR